MPSIANSDIRILLQTFLRDLRFGLPRTEVLARLKNLKSLIHAAPPDIAAHTLIEQLRLGEDSSTGLAYVIGPEGVMAETPTYRTALLDFLGQTDPFRSAEYCRELMLSTPSADEYSLALRNIAWADPDGRLDKELQSHFEVMLNRQEWRKEPTTGYLEAFDIAAATSSILTMAGLLDEVPESASGNEKQIVRAAFVALDRMMVGNPSGVVEAFRRNPNLLSRAPVHRASIMSRLDVRLAEQNALLRDYLLSSAHGEGELDYFSQIFPNANYFSGYRLVTPWQSGRDMQQVEELDGATLQNLEVWLADPAFSGPKKYLQAIVSRLKDFSVPTSDAEH